MSSWETSTAQDPSLVQLTLFSVHRNVHSIMHFSPTHSFSTDTFSYTNRFSKHTNFQSKKLLFMHQPHTSTVYKFSKHNSIFRASTFFFNAHKPLEVRRQVFIPVLKLWLQQTKWYSHLQHKAKWLARSTWQWLDSLKHLFSHGQNSLRGFACSQERLKESVALPFQFSASSVPSNVHTMYSLIQSQETVCNRNKKVLNTEKLEKKWMKQTL